MKSDCHDGRARGAIAAVAIGALAFWYMKKRSRAAEEATEPGTPVDIRKKRNTEVALLGDVGGTNVRLTLKRLNMKDRTSEEIKELTFYNS